MSVHRQQAKQFAAIVVSFLLLATLSACEGCSDSIATGERATIRVDPNTLIFDGIAMGSTQEAWVEVSNIGTATLKIDGHRWLGSSSEFSLRNLNDLRLAPGETHSFQVVYAPRDPEADQATLILLTNASNPEQARVQISSLGQSSQIQAIPNPVLVDVDRLNERHEFPIQLYNIGSRPFQINALALEAGTGAWSLSLAEMALPITIGADQSLELQAAFHPATGGSHEDRILVSCNADNCVNGTYAIELKGTAHTPYVVLAPPEIAFGRVPIGETVTDVVTVSNRGQATAVIHSIQIAENPIDDDDEIGILEVNGAPWNEGDLLEIAPGESAPIVVYYSPQDNRDDSELLVVISNDPDMPIQQVRLSGRAAAPRLEVIPSVVEFGSVAYGFGPVDKRVTILNIGSDDLLLEPLGFRDNTGAFTLLNETSMPSRLGPDESFELRIRFDPPNPDLVPTDAYFGTVFVLPKNDPITQEVIVQLEGFRAEAPVCEIRVVPPTINFGTVPRGTRMENRATFQNRGSGPCDIQSIRLESSFLGFMFSNYFSYEGASIRTPYRLDPGEEFTVTASYFPRTVTPMGEVFGDGGSIEVRVTDPYAGDVTCGVPAGAFTGSTRKCGVNLQGRSAIADMAVIPGSVDFGAVTLGCNSQQQAVRVYNTGTASVEITDIRLEGCGSSVTLGGVPVLPHTLPRDGNKEFTLRFRPPDVGEVNCSLIVEGTMEGGGGIVVPIRGHGVTTAHTIDYNEQISGRQVDVLFVVDNSGSMSEEQNNLNRNFSAFSDIALSWESDFHLGVVTTQVEGTVKHPAFPSTQPGQLVGSPRIITPATPSFTTVFTRNAKVGTADAGSRESGLESAWLALSDPQITDLRSPCDADCTEPYACTSGVDGSGSLCGGYNRTFLRETASLELIIVSDEEDQSRGTVPFYTDFFRSLKGTFNTDLFHASAIVGPSGGCSSSDGSADAGERYMEIARATGGVIYSICEREFASALAEIGNRAFGLRRQFGLSRVADPSSVQVHRLASCPGGSRSGAATGWRYDSGTNSVIWNEGSIPPAGTCFEVEYNAACF